MEGAVLCRNRHRYQLLAGKVGYSQRTPPPTHTHIHIVFPQKVAYGILRRVVRSLTLLRTMWSLSEDTHIRTVLPLMSGAYLGKQAKAKNISDQTTLLHAPSCMHPRTCTLVHAPYTRGSKRRHGMHRITFRRAPCTLCCAYY